MSLDVNVTPGPDVNTDRRTQTKITDDDDRNLCFSLTIASYNAGRSKRILIGHYLKNASQDHGRGNKIPTNLRAQRLKVDVKERTPMLRPNTIFSGTPLEKLDSRAFAAKTSTMLKVYLYTERASEEKNHSFWIWMLFASAHSLQAWFPLTLLDHRTSPLPHMNPMPSKLTAVFRIASLLTPSSRETPQPPCDGTTTPRRSSPFVAEANLSTISSSPSSSIK
ncbi:hypothetical protein V9T40_000343 [Parthenolecanium corni]|uniref:Uncharacterized protein n=1 Tax=Parthenolecanium corni TaxID=536013 RepID=A0AAN9TCR0_9HEMI